jgi:A/G-specific adenine glycosylase
VAAFAARLLAWFDAHRRDLPWRRTSDPWAIWVSEVMLQQTRVEAVRKSFSEFIHRFPRPADFATTTDDELLTAWRGLGYYRRARLLRQGAQTVVAEHAGEVPSSPEALAALPGIGTYTMGAIASIAFGHAQPAVDGNVERVFARHLAIRDPVKVGVGRRAVRTAAVDHLPVDRPGDFNQALMELGAIVCTPRSPRCQECPVARDCAGLAQGLIEELPVLPTRRTPVDVHARVVLVERRSGTVLGPRVPAGEVNAGQIDLPGPGPLVGCSGAEELTATLWERFETAFQVGDEIGSVRHAITHHRITLTAHRGQAASRTPPSLLAARPDDPTTPWTTLARKIFALAGQRATEP